MNRQHIVQVRLANQRITRAWTRGTANLVAWLGAVQAQEYGPAKWGLALRMKRAMVDRDIERAVSRGLILRTHVMRPTWHFVTPDDIRWMLELTAPQVQRVMAGYNRQLELDAAVLTKGTGVIERALGEGQFLTRTELRGCLERAGIPMDTRRLAHLVMHAELEAVICSGPRRGKQFTYALLAERAPRARRLGRDEAVAELARRYFRSHGPATVRDFVWWSGLRTPDAKRGLEIIRARAADIDGRTYWTVGATPGVRARRAAVHLLPIYDEYTVAYRDRGAVPHGPVTFRPTLIGSVTFQHALVIDGQVAGTWRIASNPRGVQAGVHPLRPLTAGERRAIVVEVKRYARFMGLPVGLTVHR